MIFHWFICGSRIKDYVQLENEYKVYGITQNITSDEFMIVFDKFYSKRNRSNGICENCDRYNTSKHGAKHVTLKRQLKDGRVEIKKLTI